MKIKTKCRSILILIGLLFWSQHGISQTPDTTWVYKSINDKDLELSVFLPSNYKNSEKEFPTIAIFHGGAWNKGDVSMHFPDCTYWSKRGMIAISVDYRLKTRDNVEVPLECVKDAKSVIRFLRKNAKNLKVNPNKIVTAGGSAEGQLAAATAMITDEKINDDFYNLSISCVPNAVILYNPWFKCSESLSPPFHITKNLPSIITFSGGQDPGIPVQQMIDFHNALKKVGNPSELYIGKKGKHGFCNGRNKNNRFFYWSLEYADEFLVKNNILSGENLVVRPNNVQKLTADEYQVYR
ncbi:alpha/beta hydrolase [Wenyingzhuangia aestuarii]|uniref:alpha/beta hydrolase n=1 Tax=Wenyingzhuangia aestuarii TaxID=1647582 RepID=UPI00143C5351|nr:alpha/beta hydrolase [Wenyingzhuangia aestuarii]NJB82545.1 acetyl esterase/lipase [Wenyingzhuangia aestuarii]